MTELIVSKLAVLADIEVASGKHLLRRPQQVRGCDLQKQEFDLPRGLQGWNLARTDHDHLSGRDGNVATHGSESGVRIGIQAECCQKRSDRYLRHTQVLHPEVLHFDTRPGGTF